MGFDAGAVMVDDPFGGPAPEDDAVSPPPPRSFSPPLLI